MILSLVSIIHLSICLSASYNFMVHFSSQNALILKVTLLRGRLLGFAHLLFNRATKKLSYAKKQLYYGG